MSSAEAVTRNMRPPSASMRAARTSRQAFATASPAALSDGLPAFDVSREYSTA